MIECKICEIIDEIVLDKQPNGQYRASIKSKPIEQPENMILKMYLKPLYDNTPRK